MEVLVLAVKRYNFQDETREGRVEGTQLTYIEGLDNPIYERDMKGVFPLTVTNGSSDFFDNFHELPAYYDVMFRQIPGRGGKPQIKPVAANFIKSFLEPDKDLKAVK